jgi:hypothetical protein
MTCFLAIRNLAESTKEAQPSDCSAAQNNQQVKQWRKQQQNVLPQPALPDYNNRAGPQQCVRKHFLLLSFLSQQKIILLTHCWELLQPTAATNNDRAK